MILIHYDNLHLKKNITETILYFLRTEEDYWGEYNHIHLIKGSR